MTRNLELGFAFAALLLLASGALSFRNIQQLSDSEQWVAHTHEVIDNLEGAISALKDAETGYRGYHITGIPASLEPYTSGVDAFPKRVATLRALVVDNPPQLARVEAFETHASGLLDRIAHGIEVRVTDGPEASLALLQSDTARAEMDLARSQVEDMQVVERQLLAIRSERSEESHTVAIASTFVSALLGLGLVGVGYGLTGRDRQAREREAAVIREANVALEHRVQQRTAELRREQEFQSALLQHVTDGIVACDAEGNLTLFNRATREFHGLPEVPIPAERWAEHYDLFMPDGVTPMRKADVPLFRALAGEEVRDVEMIIAPRDGQRRILLASGRAFVGEGGKLLGAVVSMRDVTRERRDEEERRRFVRRLQESNRELEQFATIASHDLQEPLRKIQAFSDRLREDYAAALEGRGADYLARILSATGRMRTLIDDLLSFSRVTRRNQPFVQTDLAAVAADVASDLEARLRDTGGTIRIGSLPTVHADPSQMRQLLQNLVGNALKFHHPDRPPVVELEAGPGDELFHEIVVSDNGIGFEARYAERIFQMFQRLHGRGTHEGNGIGLAICRRIAERHDGGISADAIPGDGATFTVRLARRPVAKD